MESCPEDEKIDSKILVEYLTDAIEAVSLGLDVQMEDDLEVVKNVCYMAHGDATKSVCYMANGEAEPKEEKKERKGGGRDRV